jgi:hypothetical protein
MNPKVFISVGSAGTPTQKEASESIFQTLETAGLSPRQMNKNEWSSEQPLRAIRRVIEECDGVVVIAFSRYQFGSGIERKKDGTEQPLTDVRQPTVWNQIEAAMGYMKNLPLLVIAEHGLQEDGLLEGRYDWKVYWTSFQPEELKSEAFRGFLQAWKRLITEGINLRSQRIAGTDLDLSKMTLKQLVGHLSVPQVWGILSAIMMLLVAVASIAYSVGGGKWPYG